MGGEGIRVAPRDERLGQVEYRRLAARDRAARSGGVHAAELLRAAARGVPRDAGEKQICDARGDRARRERVRAGKGYARADTGKGGAADRARRADDARGPGAGAVHGRRSSAGAESESGGTYAAPAVRAR